MALSLQKTNESPISYPRPRILRHYFEPIHWEGSTVTKKNEDDDTVYDEQEFRN